MRKIVAVKFADVEKDLFFMLNSLYAIIIEIVDNVAVTTTLRCEILLLKYIK